jgi:AcrR family transcriptional regulator
MPNDVRTPKGERAKERILDAAEQVFSRAGFKAASSSEIAAIAQVKQPALYHYFDSKEALYAAVLHRAFQPLIDQMEAVIAADGQVPSTMPDRIMDLHAAHPNASLLIFQALLSDDEVGRAILFEGVARMIRPGNVLYRRLNPVGDERQFILLNGVMMLLCHGFLVLQPLLARLLGIAEGSPELMTCWKQMLVHLHRWLLAHPPDASLLPPPAAETRA